MQPSAEAPAGHPADAPVADDVESRARAAQAALVFHRARASNLVAPPFGLLVCWLLWPLQPHDMLIAWWVVLTTTVCWREALHQCFLRDDPARAPYWAGHFLVAVTLNGVALGLIGTVLLPANDPAVTAILLASDAAIAAVGLVVLSTRLDCTMAMCLPVLLPTIITQSVAGTRLSTFTAVAMVFFLGLVVLEGRQLASHTLEMLRLRFRMDELATQRQHALNLAERSSAVKSEFLATMSHEMRTPLHGILGLTRLMRAAHGTADAAQSGHRLELIERTGDHLLGLINDVLDYSKIEKGHLRLEPSAFDLAALIESVTALSRVAAEEKGLALHTEAALAAPCWVWADASRLRQVLLNLLGNAVKFTEHGHVLLRVQRNPAGQTRWEVIDTGPGIPAHEQDQIFDAFRQVDSSFGRRHGGTGLGLTISRDLARAMQGDLVCAASDTGGARFELTLPLPPAPAQAAAQAAQAPQAAAPAAGPLRGQVLVAEDNPVNAMVAQAMLQAAGLQVDLVDNGLAAVERAAAQPYDLILMDCQMPGMDGFEAAAQIRENERARSLSAVPIVALTANAHDSDRQRSIACGMDAHMAKPFLEADLLALLSGYLQRA
jgi:signal transduction histidine kinase/ActR/RegA family two-component response regulator